MNTSPNRLVAIATPLVFAPLAGTITALAAKYAPGLDIDQGQLEAIFIAGATIAFAKSGLWLKGWQEHEKRQDEAQAAAAHAADDPWAHADDIDDEAFDFDLDDIGDEELEDGEGDDALVEQAA